MLNAWTYGGLYVLERLWEGPKLAEVVGALAEALNVEFRFERG